MQKFLSNKLTIALWRLIRFGILLVLISVPQYALVLLTKQKVSYLEAWAFFLIAYAIALFFLLKTVRPYHVFKRPNLEQLKLMFYAWLAIYALNIIYSTLSMGSQTENNLVLEQLFALSRGVTFIMATMTIIFAPLCEELLFRGVLINSFAPKYRGWAIFISGLAFGLVHLNSTIVGSLLYIGIGWILAYCYCRYNNLTLNWGIHFLVNLPATLFILFS